MKCDELKAKRHIDEDTGIAFSFYGKYEADAAIAELKQKLQDQCISCPVKMQEDDVVAELKQKLEDAKATAYAESVDAGMENRRLKRTLWLSRALRARDKAFEYHFKNNVEMCAKWDNVHLMLMAKAEEYK